jgi:diguanylate cyclase (GGDEF)-like protein
MGLIAVVFFSFIISDALGKPIDYHFNTLAETLLKQQAEVAIMLMALDGFKSVNDLYGHNIGDKVLVEVAKTLKDYCGSGCIVGRLSGDEFIIATADSSPEVICQLADRLLTAVAKTTADYGNITANIGICCRSNDAQDLSHAKSLADTAMYTAKRLGKGRYHFYSEDCVQKIATAVS